MSAIRYRYRAGLGYGGFSGKARRNRERARAARWDAAHMLDEYGDADTHAERHERFIPIGHISEFLPSAEQSADDREAAQLELPLERSHAPSPGAGNPGIRFAARSDQQREPAPADDELAACDESGQAWEQQAPTAGWKVSWRHPANLQASLVRATRPLSGLAYGCAIGGAAAAAVLVVIRVAIL